MKPINIINNITESEKQTNVSNKVTESASENYYVINQDDFQKLVDLNKGVFETYITITADEYHQLAARHEVE